MIREAIKDSFIIQLLIVATILTSGLIMNFLQLLLHIFVKPFNSRVYQKFNGIIHWSWLSREYFESEPVYFDGLRHYLR